MGLVECILLLPYVGTDLVLQLKQFFVVFRLECNGSLVIDDPQTFVVLLPSYQLANKQHGFFVVEQLVAKRGFEIRAEEQGGRLRVE